MWDDPHLDDERDRYLVLGYAHRPASDVVDALSAEGLLVYGPLLSDDGTLLLGAAAILAADDPDQAGAVLSPARYAGIEVHRWQPGGRPSGG